MDTRITRLGKKLPGGRSVTRYCATFTAEEIQQNENGTNLLLANFPNDAKIGVSVDLCVNENGIFVNYPKPTAIQNGRLLFLNPPEEGAVLPGQSFVLTAEFTRE
jgi:hypothetical protein